MEPQERKTDPKVTFSRVAYRLGQLIRFFYLSSKAFLQNPNLQQQQQQQQQMKWHVYKKRKSYMFTFFS